MEYLFLPLILAAIIIWFVATFMRSRYLIHMMQLEGYKNDSFSKWLIDFGYRAFYMKLKLSAVASIAVVVLATVMGKIEEPTVMGGVILAWSAFIVFGMKFKREKLKKDLVFTQRVKRLFAIQIIFNVVAVAVAITLLKLFIDSRSTVVAIMLVLGSVMVYFEPYILMVSNVIAKPIEERVNRKFFVMAQKKIRGMSDLKVVGITGSFGKTSTKFLMATILSEKYKTLKTPESYNTPMGVSKVINETLDSSYEAFVAEMGARNVGDIAEMGELVGHGVGVLTSVGPAHLETFKSIENIMKTKYEIIDSLPPDGIAVFNYENEYVRKLADGTKDKRKLVYGISDRENLDVYARDIMVNATGSEFILGNKDGSEISCKTNLLGEHNILNLLAGAAVGLALGLTMEEIARGISKVEPVPHRLQLINPGTGVIIIDDAFNSNPVGSKAALEVLSQFQEGRKIIITPGMIELGDEEYEANKEFGRNIGKHCDYAILVGKNRTKPIYEGVIESGFNANNVFVVAKLDDATAKLQTIVRPKDVVLFENDLPDNFNE